MPLENEKIEVAEEKETEMPNVEELLKIQGNLYSNLRILIQIL